MTTQEILIRDERKADVAAITEVTVAAFKTLEISSHTEQFIIEALCSAGGVLHSFIWRTFSARHCHVSRRIQSKQPTRRCRERLTAVCG